MKARRGVAMIAALWLVVAIAVVALQFSLDAKERRVLGIDTAERGVARAAANGALALTQARIDLALRNAAMFNRGNVQAMRSSDPLLDVDSLYSGPVMVDSIAVDVRARDIGSQLNINMIAEGEWRAFFTFVLKDGSKAEQLSQSILDWRDIDDVARVSGGERTEYLRAGQLALPANADFREVSDLLLVKGMTPEIYARISPYLTMRGGGFVNLNTAPEPVLRALPGMTDLIINAILALRSGGQRIQSVQQVLSLTTRGSRLTPAQQAASNQLNTALSGRTVVDTREVDLTITARAGPAAEPAKLIAILSRGAVNVTQTVTNAGRGQTVTTSSARLTGAPPTTITWRQW